MQGMNNQNYNPSLKPKTLVCYICGREYGTKSLEIHLKTCQEKFLIEESKKPKNQRRPLPQPPKAITGAGGYDIDSYNDSAFNVYKEQALERCNYCGRTFNRESFPTHLKVCSPNKPFKPLPGFVQDPKKVQQQQNTREADQGGYKAASTNAPPKRPKTLMCYICGREYGTKSLAIHIPQCKEMFFVQESKKPKSERRNPPTTPRGLMELLSKDEITYEDLESYNTGAFNKYNKEALEPCRNCGRTFRPEALAHHMKACTAEKPFKPLEEGDQEGELVPCRKCGRKFIPSRVEKHEAACKDIKMSQTATGFQKPAEQKEQQPSVNNKYRQTFQVQNGTEKNESLDQEPQTIKVTKSKPPQQNQLLQSQIQQNNASSKQSSDAKSNLPCFKCYEDCLTSSQLMSHILQCKGAGVKPEIFDDLAQVKTPSQFLIDLYRQQVQELRQKQNRPTLQASQPSASLKQTPAKQAPTRPTMKQQQQEDYEDESERIEMVVCQKCDRHFARDRIQKHQKVCKGKDYFEKKEHIVEVQKAPKTGWRKYHEEFIATVKYNRKLKEIQESGGDIRQLGPPPASSNDNYIPCPYCQRKFDPSKAEKHIAICQNVVNKPKPVNRNSGIPQKASLQMDQKLPQQFSASNSKIQQGKNEFSTPSKASQLLSPPQPQFKIRSSPNSGTRATNKVQAPPENIFRSSVNSLQQNNAQQPIRKSQQHLQPLQRRY